MLNLEGKQIIYLADVAIPPGQAGKAGEVRTICRESNFAANFLLRGGRVKLIETQAEIHAVWVDLGLEKPSKTERRASVGKRTVSTRDKKSN